MKFTIIKYLSIIILSGLVIPSVSLAQEIKVHTYLDTTSILIGDQIKYRIDITQNKNIDSEFPVFADTLVNKVEIIENSKIDTTYLNTDVIKISKELTITSFDSGFYVLPAIRIPYVENNQPDTALSDILVLGVFTFEIDTVRGITDIKPPIDTPLTFSETVPYIVIGLSAILLISLILWLYTKYRKKEEIVIRREIPKEPAHLIALRNLDSLKTRKLWQQGKVKLFHSELTEILRIFIENRFGLQAMEQTSDEVLDFFTHSNLLKSGSYEKLEHILKTADFVKFAKFQPLPDENEVCFDYAYKIVMENKLREDLSKKKDEVADIKKSQDINPEKEILNN